MEGSGHHGALLHNHPSREAVDTMNEYPTCAVPTNTLQVLFDLVVGSMDYGSGFLDKEDVECIVKVARILGVEGDLTAPGGRHDGYYHRTESHLWHQDCALRWLCGKPANDPIHTIELPA